MADIYKKKKETQGNTTKRCSLPQALATIKNHSNSNKEITLLNNKKKKT